ncbi:hypothetical protein GW17_00062185 [Ensete ventricosum]|nr:hypothetical protein GW17_00062185 [Ensete ventricosum]
MRRTLRRIKFRSVFHAPSRKFKILANPNVLDHGKSHEHGFMRKCDGHKHYAKSRLESSFDWFYVHRLKNSKCWPFPMYYYYYFLVSKDNVFCKRFVQRSFVYTSHRLKPEVS